MKQPIYRLTIKSLHIDSTLLGILLLTIIFGFFILYSASNANLHMVLRQAMHLLLASLIMLTLTMIPPHKYKLWTPWVYLGSLLLLIAVMLIGKSGKGAQRWLDLGLFRFQPSEIMKLAAPMMSAWYVDHIKKKITYKHWLYIGLIIFIPAFLIAKQPDLGTSIMVMAAGISVIFLAGIPMRILLWTAITISLTLPIIWHHMHDYQRQRIYTLFNPEADPLGAGYHILQSKIAIGSGGSIGKGWLTGSQSHLNFLPEHATDFIFAVGGEEFGLLGSGILIILFVLMSMRSLQIAANAQTVYTRLVAVGLSMTFFVSTFVNIGMVIGILPVVGIPLPFISYGGTSMVTFLASFGVLMSISSHKILFTTIR